MCHDWPISLAKLVMLGAVKKDLEPKYFALISSAQSGEGLEMSSHPRLSSKETLAFFRSLKPNLPSSLSRLRAPSLKIHMLSIRF